MKLRTIVLILGTLLAMSYDPRTGITSYRDVEDSAEASDPAPSTATALAPSLTPGEFGYQYDPYGNAWRQGDGGWERMAGLGQDDWRNQSLEWFQTAPMQRSETSDEWLLADPFAGANWAAGDPNRVAPSYAKDFSGLMHDATLGNASDPWAWDRFFDTNYSPVSRSSGNPYYDTKIRDSMRSLAEKLGLSSEDADRAALEFAQSHLEQNGNWYTDASHPAVVANAVAQRLFDKAGQEYQGLTPDQIDQFVADASQRQQNNKEWDRDSWKRDNAFGGLLAAWGTQIEDVWDGSINADATPTERFFMGADNPWNTWIHNTLWGKDYDPYGNVVALPTEQQYEEAAREGADVSAATFYNAILQQAAMMIGSSMLGDAVGTTVGTTADTAAAVAGTADTAVAAGTAGAASTATSVSQILMSLTKQFAINLALSGGDYKEALKSTLMNAGVSYGGSALGGLGDSVPSELPSDVPSNPVPVEPDWKRRGMLAFGDTDTMFDVAPGLFDGAASMPPAILDTGEAAMMPVAALDTGGAGMMPSALPESDPTFGGALQETSPGVYLDGPSEQQPKPTSEQTSKQQRAQENAKMTENLAKYARAIAEMHDGEGEPQDAPRREEGQDDAAYAQTLVEYANLDAQALADAGLTPGTTEYYEYIMQQMDSIIGQITDGIDPDDATLSDRLRAKTREELDALERALFVRGQIGQLMGSGRYTDPFTGVNEDVIAPEGRKVRPGVAAYHRGLARSADEVAGMRPQEARRYVGGMLDRNPDLYGMEASASDRALNEMFASQGEDWKRRRGMLSGR